jgi:uncharacterized protein (DUF362 family)
MSGWRVAVARVDGDPAPAIRRALEEAGILARVVAGARVALKPNFTYPVHRPGITTSPAILRALVSVLRERTSRIAIVESDGGYGVWTAPQAFEGHGVPELVRDFGVEAVNLCDEPREWLEFSCRGREHRLPLPVRLLRETDVFLTLPVPKIHAMTGLTLAFKNQWGCIPDVMRLRRHYIFDDAIVAIDRALRPAVLGDGTTFLDDNGPMDGTPVPMDLVIAADRAGAFDRYVAELMGFPWRRVSHLRRAAELGELPERLEEIRFETPPQAFRTREFRLRRSLRNWIALSGFKSRFLTWFGYESWFGRVVLHAILYAIVGRPERPGHGPRPA